MELNKMSHKTLVNWVVNLDKSIQNCDCEHNLKLFEKWKQDALTELKQREERKERYLKWRKIK